MKYASRMAKVCISAVKEKPESQKIQDMLSAVVNCILEIAKEPEMNLKGEKFGSVMQEVSQSDDASFMKSYYGALVYLLGETEALNQRIISNNLKPRWKLESDAINRGGN
jgi:hypothetical protein